MLLVTYHRRTGENPGSLEHSSRTCISLRLFTAPALVLFPPNSSVTPIMERRRKWTIYRRNAKIEEDSKRDLAGTIASNSFVRQLRCDCERLTIYISRHCHAFRGQRATELPGVGNIESGRLPPDARLAHFPYHAPRCAVM